MKRASISRLTRRSSYKDKNNIENTSKGVCPQNISRGLSLGFSEGPLQKRKEKKTDTDEESVHLEANPPVLLYNQKQHKGACSQESVSRRIQRSSWRKRKEKEEEEFHQQMKRASISRLIRRSSSKKRNDKRRIRRELSQGFRIDRTL